MFTILLHSSKTMKKPSGAPAVDARPPQFLPEASELVGYLSTLSTRELEDAMAVSESVAERTRDQYEAWLRDPLGGLRAIDAFTGDIYSGFQVGSLSREDRHYADRTLVILSGLYGALLPLDSVMPYRLEMAYKFDDEAFANLYAFWGNKIADSLPKGRTIINVSSKEYTKAILGYLKSARIITPRFLSVAEGGEPKFVTVHAKIARGAFARWIIQARVEDEAGLREFSELNYHYDASLSTELEPVFVARPFEGLGMSVRLQK